MVGLAALACLAALLLTAGSVGAAFAVLHRRPRRPSADAPRETPAVDGFATRAAIGVTAAAAVLLLTGWPVGALWAGAFGMAAPTLREARRRRKSAIARMDAVAAWVATVRGLTNAGMNLRRALVESADAAPSAITAEVAELARDLRRRAPTAVALAAFQRSMDDPVADRAAVSLALAATEASGRLAAQLTSLERAARRLAEVRREAEAEADKDRATVRGAAAVGVLAIPVLNAWAPQLFGPAKTAAGQAALALTGLVYAGGLCMLARLERFSRPDAITIPSRRSDG